MVKRSTRSTSSSHTLRRRLGVTMELMMECQDDDLSPSQVEAMRKSRLEYNNAMAQIKEAQNKARLGKATVSIQKTYGQTTPAKNAQPAAILNSKPDNGRSSSPDVIIVGESPPKQKTTPTPVAAKPRPTVPPPHIVVSRPIQNNVNINARNQPPTLLKVIPVSSQPVQYTYTTPSGHNPQSIRPSKLIPSVAAKSPYPSIVQQPQIVTPAQQSAANLLWNLQTKRNLENAQDSGGSAKKKQRKADTNDVGNWVPLDEYYYGKMEGDPSYVEDKGEFRFKCWYCSKMLYNNVKAMMHIQGHIDSGKQHNLDLSDLTQCKHCYKQFDTPFEMQTHVEKVHMNGANVLLCRICERDHESRNALTHHMRQNHTACEMPYICQLCNFRSSMYSDVVDHFKKKHDSSQHILCLYCLKVFKVKFVSQGWGQTQTYYGHLLKHQSKTATKKCTLCRLTFYNMPDVKSHKKKDHMANHKGILGTNNKYTTPGQVMIKVPESGLHNKQQSVKSLNAPTVSKVLDFGGTKFPTLVNYLTCLECKMSMGTPDHFKKHIECSMCRFATSCSIAYANHMMGFHSGQMSSLNLNIPWERRMESPMYCLCGFNSKYGNRIANHLVYCTKRTCYRDKQAATDDGASDEEVGDPRRKPGASLLDVLGLVKKRTVATKIRRSSREDDRSIPPFRVSFSNKPKKSSPETEDSTDNKEETTPPDITDSAPNVPPELKGSRKWMTVKIKDKVSPTKASVFLGVEDADTATKGGKNESEQDTSESPHSEKVNSQNIEAMEVSEGSQDQSSEVIDSNKPITDDQTKSTDSEKMESENVKDNDKDLESVDDETHDRNVDDDRLLDDNKDKNEKDEDDKLLNDDELLKEEKYDEALLKEDKDDELLKEEKDDEALLKEEKDDEALLKEEKDDEALLKEEKDDEALLKEEKDDEALLKEEKDYEALVKEVKDDEALLKEEKDYEALLKEGKDDEALLKEEKDNEAPFRDDEKDEELLKEGKDDEALLRDDEKDEEHIKDDKEEEKVLKDNKNDELLGTDNSDQRDEEESDDKEEADDDKTKAKDDENDDVEGEKELKNEELEERERDITSSVDKDFSDNENKTNETSDDKSDSVAMETDKEEISRSDVKSIEDREISKIGEDLPEDITSTPGGKVEESEEVAMEETSTDRKQDVEPVDNVIDTDKGVVNSVEQTDHSHVKSEKSSDHRQGNSHDKSGVSVDHSQGGQDKSGQSSDHSHSGQDKSGQSSDHSHSGQDKSGQLSDHSHSGQDKSGHSSDHSHDKRDKSGDRDRDSRSSFSPEARKDSYRNHGDRSYGSNHQDRRSHDSRGYDSHDRSRDHYKHGDHSHDHKRSHDNDYHQRDRYNQDRRDNRGYQDNRNYHGNHPYGNRNRDDRKRDGHYDNYNRNQGHYNRGGQRGGYGGYGRGYQGNYR